jgi:hypothetical protein
MSRVIRLGPAPKGRRGRSTIPVVECLEDRALLDGDRFEPNNTLAQATPLGPIVGNHAEANLSIDKPSDVDWFQFQLGAITTGDREIDFLFQSPGPDAQARMDLYDASGTFLTAAVQDSPYQGNLILPLTYRPAGTYYVKVSSFSNPVTGATTIPNYYLAISSPLVQPDGLEPNDTLAAAHDFGVVKGQLIQYNLTIHPQTLSLNPTGNEDWYKFTTTAAGGAGDGVTVDFVNALGSLDLELYNSAGVKLASTPGAGDRDQVSLAGRPAGTYYAHVFAHGGGLNLGTYSLKIDTPGAVPDAYEPNDTMAQATDLGVFPTTGVFESKTLTNLSISTPGDVDWFRFQLPFAGRPADNVEAEFQKAPTGQFHVSLYDAGGTLLADQVGDSGAGFDLESRPAGTYYVRVAGVNGYTIPNYFFGIGNPFQPPLPVPPDRFEPDDGRSTAADLGLVQGQRVESNLSINAAGNDDWYRFQTAAAGVSGSAVRIDFQNGLGNLDLELYDGVGNFLGRSAGTGNAEQISLTGRAAGVYFVRVFGAGGAVNPSYALTINAPGAPADRFEPDDTQATAADLHAIQGQQVQANLTIPTPDDVDWFRFQTVATGTAGNSVRIDYQRSQGDLNLEVYDASGDLVGESIGVGDSDQVSLDGRPGGTYYARVYDADGTPDPGSYSLTVAAPTAGSDRFEPDETFATARDLGQVLGLHSESGLTISSPGDNDWYRFTTAAVGGPSDAVRIDYASALGGLGLELYSSGGARLATAGAVGDSEQVSLAGRPAGAYYVHVFGANGAFNAQGYTLTIRAPGSPDRDEPNDSQAQATGLGLIQGTSVASGLSIHTAGDVDWFRFQIAAGAAPGHEARIDFQNSLGALDLSLYDGAGNLLASASGGDDREEVSLAGRPAGTYLVQVRGDGGATNPSYALTIVAPGGPGDRFDPNNSRATAHDFGTINGLRVEPGLSLNTPGGEDWFKFTTTAAGGAGDRVRIDFLDAQGDLDLELYDGSGPLLDASQGSTDDEEVSLGGRPAGTYFVRVFGRAGAINPGGYSLTIQAPGFGPDRFEPNDTLATATNLGTVRGRLALDDLTTAGSSGPFGGDADYYRIALAAPGSTSDYVRIDTQSVFYSPELDLLDSGGNLLSGNSGFGGQVSLAGRPAGTYYIKVADSEFDDFPSPTTYALTINAPDPLGDRLEPNDTRGTATDLHAVRGTLERDGLSISTAADVDWFKFATTATGAVGHEVRIDFAQADGDLDLELYDASGNLLSASDSIDDGESISLAGRPAGTYYARVLGVGGAINPDYRLTITAPGAAPDRFEPNNGLAAATDLRAVQGVQRVDGLSIDAPGDVDWFAFTTVADARPGQSVRVDFNNAEGTLSLELDDASGTVIGRSTGPSDHQEISLIGRPAGTYYAKVSGASAGVAGVNYSLTINAPGQGPDPFEPNDSAAAATYLGPVQGHRAVGGLSINTSADQDWFSFSIDSEAAAGQSVGINFQGAEGDLDLELYNQYGTLLSRSAGAGDAEAVSLAGLPAGYYLVHVFGFAGATNSDYTLTIDAPGAVPDRLDAPSGAGAGGVTDLRQIAGTRVVDGLTIHAADLSGMPDVDVFRFETVAVGGASNAIRLTYPAGLGDLDIALYDQDLRPLRAATGSGGTRTISLNGLPAGTYHLKVSGVAGATNAYSLRFDAPRTVPNDWTIMVYMTASTLEQHAFDNINQMEAAASVLPGSVHIAVLLDQSSAPGRTRFPTGGDPTPWGDTGRAIIQPDTDPGAIATPFDRSTGEQDTGDPATLSSFIAWAAAQAPASHYALILWDHGNGVRGFNVDDSDGAAPDSLSPAELAAALTTAAVHFDLVGFDSCLMAMAEVGYRLRGLAPVLVGSEDMEPGSGFDYSKGFAPLVSNPGADAQTVATGLVQSFQTQYQDTPATPDTLSATNLAGYDGLAAALKAFTAAVGAVADAKARAALAAALAADRNALHDFGVERTGYRDLGRFLDAVAADPAIPAAVQAAARSARAALAGVVVAQTDDGRRDGGLSIYLPQPDTNEDGNFTPQYLADNAAFLAASGWQSLLDLLGNLGPGRQVQDPFEPNDDFTAATPLGQISGHDSIDTVSIVPGSDRDYYAFSLAADGQHGDAISVSVPDFRADTPGLLSLTLLDAAGHPLAPAVQQNSPGDTLVISLEGRPKGRYVALVQSTNLAQVPQYSFSYDAPVDADLGDPNQGHHQSDKPTQLGSVSGSLPVLNQLLTPGLDDWFTFSTPRVQGASTLDGLQGTITVTLRGSGTAVAQVLDADGTTVVDSKSGAGTLQLGFPVSASAGTFLIRVAPAVGQPGQQYDLVIQDQQDVKVVDTTAPTLVLPPNQSFEATGPGGAAVTFAGAAATDAIDPNPTITYLVGTAPIGDPASLPLGATVVTVKASDKSGNTSTGQFTITVRDTTPPKLTLPPDQTFPAAGPGGAVVTFVGATASDVADPRPRITYSVGGRPIGNGSPFPVGPTLVDVAAMDASGNTATGRFTVDVVLRGAAAGDFNGDGKTDFAIYDQTTSQYFILFNGAPGALTPQFGNPAHANVPVAGDFDGDGKADFAIYDQTQSQYFILFNGAPGALTPQFGNPAHANVPIGGDFNGDGRADFAIYDQTASQYFILFNGAPGALTPQFGNPAHANIPVGGDFNGDGKADFAVYDQTTSQYFILFSGAPGALTPQFGNPAHTNAPVTGGSVGPARVRVAASDSTTSQRVTAPAGRQGIAPPPLVLASAGMIGGPAAPLGSPAVPSARPAPRARPAGVATFGARAALVSHQGRPDAPGTSGSDGRMDAAPRTFAAVRKVSAPGRAGRPDLR